MVFPTTPLSRLASAIRPFQIVASSFGICLVMMNRGAIPSGYGIQADLSFLGYHRFHGPISDIIVISFWVSGGSYSKTYFQSLANTESQPDPVAPGNSKTYITGVVARAVLFVRANNPYIGMMACLAVGICEISSNEVRTSENKHMSAGDKLGMFRLWGSTHCLLFRRRVEVGFALEPKNGSGYDPPPGHSTSLRCVRLR